MEPRKRTRYVVPPGIERRRSQRHHESSSSHYDMSDSKFVVLMRKPRTVRKPPSPESSPSDDAHGSSSSRAARALSARATAGTVIDVVAYGNRLRQVVAQHEPSASSSSASSGAASAVASALGPFGPDGSIPQSEALWSAISEQDQKVQHDKELAGGRRDDARATTPRMFVVRKHRDESSNSSVKIRVEDGLETPSSDDKSNALSNRCKSCRELACSCVSGGEMAILHASDTDNPSVNPDSTRSNNIVSAIDSNVSGDSSSAADGSAFCVSAPQPVLQGDTAVTPSQGAIPDSISNTPEEIGDRYSYIWDTVMLLKEFKGVDADAVDEEPPVDHSAAADEPSASAADETMNSNSDEPHDLNLDDCMIPSSLGDEFEHGISPDVENDPLDASHGASSSRPSGRGSAWRQRADVRSFKAARRNITASKRGRKGRPPHGSGTRSESSNTPISVSVSSGSSAVSVPADCVTPSNHDGEPQFATQAFLADHPDRISSGSLDPHNPSLTAGPGVQEGEPTALASRTVDIARQALSMRGNVKPLRSHRPSGSFSSINEILSGVLIDSTHSSSSLNKSGSIAPIEVETVPDASPAAAAAAADTPHGALCDTTYSVLELIRLDQGRSPGYSDALHPSLLLDAFGLFFEDMRIFSPDKESPNGTSAYLHTVDYAISAAFCREMSKGYRSSHDRLMAVQLLLDIYFGVKFEPFPSSASLPVLTDHSNSSPALSCLSVSCGGSSDAPSNSSPLSAVSCVLAVQNEMCLGSQALSDECATEHFKNLFRVKNVPLLCRSNCPTVFILIAGPYLCIQLASVPDRARLDHATAFLPLLYHTGDSDAMVQVGVVLRCVKLLIKRLKVHYAALDLNSKLELVHVNQLAFPFPTRFRTDKRKELFVEIEYLHQLKPSRRVYSARVCRVISGRRRVVTAGQQLVVKFTRTYNAEAHRCCFEIDGSAPELWSCTAMPGGWFMVVMEFIGPCRAAGEVPLHVVKARLKRALFELHCAGFVHGDVRVGNVLTQISPRPVEDNESCVNDSVYKTAAATSEDATADDTGADDQALNSPMDADADQDSPLNKSKDGDDPSPRDDVSSSLAPRLRVCLLDFDGAGRAGVARYPAFMNRVDLRWPAGAREGGLIDASHDVQMLDACFGADVSVEELESSDVYGHGNCFDACVPECAESEQQAGPVDTTIAPMASGSDFFHDVNVDQTWVSSVLGAEVWNGSFEDSQSSFVVHPSNAALVVNENEDNGAFNSSYSHMRVDSGQHVGRSASTLFRDPSGASNHRESQESSSSIEIDALDRFISSWTRE